MCRLCKEDFILFSALHSSSLLFFVTLSKAVSDTEHNDSGGNVFSPIVVISHSKEVNFWHFSTKKFYATIAAITQKITRETTVSTEQTPEETVYSRSFRPRPGLR